MPDEQSEAPPFTSVILFCPVCCSTVEDATKWGPNTLECTSCTTRFVVDLKSEVIATHSVAG